MKVHRIGYKRLGWSFGPCLFVFLMLFGVFDAAAQVQGCEKLKDGKYEIYDPEEGLSTITRKDGIQREENNLQGIIVEYLIEWLNPCTFRLVPFKVIKNENNLDMEADLKLLIEIVEIREDMYVQITYSAVTNKSEVEEVKFVKGFR